MKFSELNLSEKILESLTKNGYENLTPIQEKIIPSIQEEKDVLGCSQTGSGKTGAFLIPILSKLKENKEKKAIIIAPTRELAMQIMDNAKLFLDENKSVNKSLLIGGASIREQLLSIKSKPRLIVGTPGRINDFLNSGRLVVEDFDILVLDEMDRMLDMGFSVQIDEIVKKISKKRQTMLFSATISKKIEKVVAKYLENPVVVKIGDTNHPSVNVSQKIIDVENNEKFKKLLEILKGDTVFSLVFVKTKYSTERIACKLEKENIMAKAIHGDLKQNKRAKIIRDFRNKKFNVLVATDIAARGLDIHHIDTVINYDLPQSPEDYIHRIGRCSRGMEIKGTSISFCCKDEKKLWDAIQSLIEKGDYSDDIGFNGSNKKIKKKSNHDKTEKTEKNTKVSNGKKENNKSVSIKNKKKKSNKKDSGYDIESLMSGGKKASKVKKPTSYLISKTTAEERRKKLGL